MSTYKEKRAFLLYLSLRPVRVQTDTEEASAAADSPRIVGYEETDENQDSPPTLPNCEERRVTRAMYLELCNHFV